MTAPRLTAGAAALLLGVSLRTVQDLARRGRLPGGWPLKNLRHRFAIRWLEAGGDLYDLSRHLGHSSVTTTERFYLPFVDLEKRRAAQAAQGRTKVTQRGRKGHGQRSGSAPAKRRNHK